MHPRGPSRVSRRTFIHLGAAAGIAAAAPSRSGAGADVAAARPLAGQEPAPFELAEVTLAGLAEGMAAGRWTAEVVTGAYLERIAALDGSLRSVIEVNPEALAIARALDAERREKGARGPLHGVPVLIKDNIATGDSMETTAGSLALVGVKPARDAAVAARLRAAGAVLLGKTNLSEWANFRSSQSSSGWSGRGGQCCNPYALDRSPCGSSSGSGVAVAANLAAVAVGTETDGSIVCPSHANCLVGIKPTLGLVSRAGIIPIAASQDTAGPMARTVADAAALLGVLAGPDPGDPATAAAAGRIPPDYTRFLDPDGLRGARIGVARARVSGYSPATDRLFSAALTVLKTQGAVLVDPADIPHLGDYDEAELEVLLYEFKAGLATYLSGWTAGGPRTLADLIVFNDQHADREMPFFGQELFHQAEAKGPLSDKAYRRALATCAKLSRREGLDAVFAAHRLDALVAPTGGPPWMIDLVNGDHFLGASSTPAAVSGYPSVTVPAGFARGLPVGITFIARAWGEPTLIRLAGAFERATQHRKAPRLAPSVELGET